MLVSGEHDLRACFFNRKWLILTRFLLHQHDDFTKFEKDRVLTAFEYMNSRKMGAQNFDEDVHSTRGLESLIDNKLGRRLKGEKQELCKALKEETLRQKADGTFPDLEMFRAVSSRLTRSALDRATYLAQEDAKVCRERHANFISRQAQKSMSRLKRGCAVGAGK